MKIWSLPKHEHLTTCKNIVEKRRNCSSGAISPLFQNIFNISLTSRVQLLVYLLNMVNRISFPPILQIWYVEVRISRSISDSPLEFEITRVDCISIMNDVGYGVLSDKNSISWRSFHRWMLYYVLAYLKFHSVEIKLQPACCALNKMTHVVDFYVRTDRVSWFGSDMRVKLRKYNFLPVSVDIRSRADKKERDGKRNMTP